MGVGIWDNVGMGWEGGNLREKRCFFIYLFQILDFFFSFIYVEKDWEGGSFFFFFKGGNENWEVGKGFKNCEK